MTAEFGAFKYGKVAYPLPAQAAEADLLEVCDPTVAKLLAFGQSVLETHVGPALLGAAAGFAPIPAVVGTAIPINPADVAKFDQLTPPIFAVWRVSSEKSQKTTNWQQSAWIFRMAYILPALSAEQSVRLHPVLKSVGDVISNRLHYGFDPSYNDGEKIFIANDIAACRVVSSEIGRWDVSRDLDFHAWLAELAVTEQEMPTTEGLQTLSGAGIKVSDQSQSPGNPVEVVNAEV